MGHRLDQGFTKDSVWKGSSNVLGSFLNIYFSFTSTDLYQKIQIVKVENWETSADI